MTARPDVPELSAAERERADRIEAAPAAEESWFVRKIVAAELRAAADWAATSAIDIRAACDHVRARADALDPQ